MGLLLVKQTQSFLVRDSRMNLKACCGLLTNKEDEDYDYDDIEQEPLPKPQMGLETRKKVRGSKQHSEYIFILFPDHKSQISLSAVRGSPKNIIVGPIFLRCALVSKPVGALVRPHCCTLFHRCCTRASRASARRLAPHERKHRENVNFPHHKNETFFWYLVCFIFCTGWRLETSDISHPVPVWHDFIPSALPSCHTLATYIHRATWCSQVSTGSSRSVIPHDLSVCTAVHTE